MREKTWDIYEVVLLIDAYLKIEEGLNKETILKKLSIDLRNMALNSGNIIDDKFRNLNGVAWQMNYIKIAFKESDLQAKRIPRLFIEGVRLFKNQKDEFNRILLSAKDKVGQHNKIEVSENNLNNFIKWFKRYEGKKCDANIYVNYFNEISAYAKKFNITKVDFWEIKDFKEFNSIRVRLSGNRLFKFQHPKLFTFIERWGKLYSIYLKENLCFSELDINDGKNIENNKTNEVFNVYNNQIKFLLEKYYKYGFRINSCIELMKIRNYANQHNISLPENDEDLKVEIISRGFIFEEKVYIFSNNIIKNLESRIVGLFNKGYKILFYDSYITNDAEWLYENHIMTSDILKNLLQKTNLEIYYAKNFISLNGKVTEIEGIIKEIKSKWCDKVLISYDEIIEKLPYIPEERIRHALSASEEMVWVSHETYTCLEKVIINSDDAEKIIAYIDEACDKKGFASISDAPLKSVIEENFELSMTAIYEAVFNKVLKDKFFLNGKIITKTSSGLDAVTLVKAYCEDKEECTFEELYNKVIDLTGASNRQIAFEAGYGVMVRIGENRFVADKYVSFDVSYIDSLLEEIIVEGFTSIKDITTFARFSICGQEWNHYLLESYCYRFSKKFTLNVINFNDKNAGIISKKTLGLSYKEMLAKTIVKAKIELTDNIALQYLYDNGYLAKRQYGAIGEVLKIAESLK